MALTSELIKGSSLLKDLTEEQVTAITQLSTNDENIVIGKKFKEVYDQLDNTIEASTGIKRNGDEKTYKYLERATKKLKEDSTPSEELTKQIETQKATIEDLNKQIKEGKGDEALKTKLAEAEQNLTKAKADYKTLQDSTTELKNTHAKELFDYKVGNEFKSATGSLKFNDGINEIAQKTLVDSVASKIKSEYTAVFGEDGKVTYKDKDGALLTNKDNGLEPFTTAELFQREFNAMGVLKVTDSKGGAGGKQTPPGGAGGSVSIAGAKTRQEATEAINKQLLENGMTIGSSEYDEALQSAYKENKVSELPE